MSRFKNWIYILLLVGLFFEVLVVFPNKIASHNQAQNSEAVKTDSAKAEPQPMGSSIPETKENGQQRLQGVHLVESQKGRRDWELFADVAEGNQGQGAWSLKTVKVLFYRGDKISFTVSGQSGKIEAKTKNILFSGDVQTVSENGYSFKTNTIQYIAANRSLLSPDEVQMLGPTDAKGAGLVVKGKRMLSYVDDARMSIQSDVRAEKEVSAGALLRLTSDSADFSGKNKEASFKGSVSMNYREMQITGDAVSFLYSSGADILSTMKVVGRVKLQEKDRVATSEKLSLDLLKNQFVFQGHPRLTQADDIITGDEIVFLDGGKKVKVEKIKAKIENLKN